MYQHSYYLSYPACDALRLNLLKSDSSRSWEWLEMLHRGWEQGPGVWDYTFQCFLRFWSIPKSQKGSITLKFPRLRLLWGLKLLITLGDQFEDYVCAPSDVLWTMIRKLMNISTVNTSSAWTFEISLLSLQSLLGMIWPQQLFISVLLGPSCSHYCQQSWNVTALLCGRTDGPLP